MGGADVICSDKTGTLTTAKMTINVDRIVFNDSGLSYLRDLGINLSAEPASTSDEDENKRNLVLALSILGSSQAKVEDAIDSAVRFQFKFQQFSTVDFLVSIIDFSGIFVEWETRSNHCFC